MSTKKTLDKAIKACDTKYVIKSYEGEGFKEKKNNSYHFSKKKSEWKVFNSQEEAQRIARNLPSAYIEKL